MVCRSCRLAQTTESVPAEAIFRHDYAYLSSYSASCVAHARRYAQAMIARLGLTPQSLVAEVASNHGYLLQHFVEAGIPVLGIEPAGHAARMAEARGVPTRVAFFGQALGRQLAAEGRRADLGAANNVLAHVPDIRDSAAGFAEWLAPENVVTFEFPHLLNLLRLVQFDTTYHEHYSYLSLLFVERLLGAVGLRAFDVERLPTHGGSLRAFACRAGARHAEGAGLAEVRAPEAAAGLDGDAAYAAFGPAFAPSATGSTAFSTGRRHGGAVPAREAWRTGS
jgi:Methyltransferase domain/C-methyltransferase C-terminal domain